LLDYGIPRADTLPAIAIDFSPVPSATNPWARKLPAMAALSPARRQ
jgi:hypothetical protein